MLLSPGLRYDAVQTYRGSSHLHQISSVHSAHHAVSYKQSYRQTDNISAIYESIV
jgi:hypothetical protein